MQETHGFKRAINLFNKAYMEIGKQIIKGAREMGKVLYSTFKRRC